MLDIARRLYIQRLTEKQKKIANFLKSMDKSVFLSPTMIALSCGYWDSCDVAGTLKKFLLDGFAEKNDKREYRVIRGR